jgi:glucose dehydrogenase
MYAGPFCFLVPFLASLFALNSSIGRDIWLHFNITHDGHDDKLKKQPVVPAKKIDGPFT